MFYAMNFLLTTLLFCYKSDFDRSFAVTFALPEFRAMESKLSEAQQQLSSFLTSYELIPEETAASLLTNGLLMERFQKPEYSRSWVLSYNCYEGSNQLEIGGGEAVRAKGEGEFASVVEVVLDDVPDDPLA